MIESRRSTKVALIAATLVVAVMALTVVPSMRSTAESQPAAAPAAANLTSEDRVIAKYFDDLVAYDSQAAQLGKRARLVNADLEPLQGRSSDLKSRLSGVQSTVAEVIAKLKAADEWDTLDTTVAAKIEDSAQRSFFQQSSFKQSLQEAATTLSSHQDELNTPIENLRKKLSSQLRTDGELRLIRASYVAPEPVFRVSMKCRMGTLRMGLIQRLGGKPNNATLDTVSCACNPDKGIGLGTFTSCDQLATQ